MKTSITDLSTNSVGSISIDEPIHRPKRRFNRRFWLRSLAYTAATGAGLLGWTVLIEPRLLSINHLELRLPNLPERWHGRRLVHISDMHIGRVPVGYLKSAMQRVNAFEPDLLAITGDFLDHTGGLGDDLETVLATLKPAKIATVACLGNHDYGFRWAQTHIADELVQIARQFDIQVLRDERIEYEGLSISGIDDYWSPRCNPRHLLRSMDPNAASLCLCHRPRLIPDSIISKEYK